MAQFAAETAIALPFRIDSQGNIASTTDEATIWADRVKSALGTIKGTRLMRSSYGTVVDNGFLGTISEMTGLIQNEVANIFSGQFPTLTLNSVSVNWDEDSNSITADILYKLPSQDDAQTQVGIANVASDNLINEVNL